MDFLSAPSNFLVQWFRNFESKDLGLRFPSLEFSRTSKSRESSATAADDKPVFIFHTAVARHVRTPMNMDICGKGGNAGFVRHMISE